MPHTIQTTHRPIPTLLRSYHSRYQFLTRISRLFSVASTLAYALPGTIVSMPRVLFQLLSALDALSYSNNVSRQLSEHRPFAHFGQGANRHEND
ncbi:hypothetical protein BofuT4_uP123470.1 [Botrytis cinerea T4]|uniref:Uncharacterized protein n=1 Tax=Botryotinia fuckeliana (strain T4) TaxID=999810 RepID=G2YNY0_BOTF4|nr:hypothetical protein BofuT4_uP123470.1 [Botrytis cinerea T4]